MAGPGLRSTLAGPLAASGYFAAPILKERKIKMNMTPKRKIQEATEALFNHAPGFASIILSHELVETKELPTMATDSVHLFYNPEFVNGMSIRETEFIIWHEAKHVWLKHFVRLPNETDHAEKNIAFDLAINSLDDLVKPSQAQLDRFWFPGVGPAADLPVGKDAEFYFNARRKAAQQPPDQGQGEPEKQDQGEKEPGEGQDQGEEGSKSSQEEPEGQEGDEGTQDGGESSQGDSESKEDGSKGESGDEGAPGDAEGEGEGEGQGDAEGQEQIDRIKEAIGEGKGKGKGQPGSGKPENGFPDAEYGLGDVLPYPGDLSDQQEAAKAESRWTELVTRGMQIERMAGKGAGWFVQESEKMLGESKTDWRTLLRRFMVKSIPIGKNWNQINRRHGWRSDVLFPARRSKGGVDGAIITDTSGSMWGYLQKVMPEISKILQSLKRSTVTVFQNDDRLIDEATRKFSTWEMPIKIPVQWKGGGGTDLNAAFRAVAKRRGEFRYLIIVSDMIWNYQSAPDPKIPVLWLVVGPYWIGDASKETMPKFGTVIRMPA